MYARTGMNPRPQLPSHGKLVTAHKGLLMLPLIMGHALLRGSRFVTGDLTYPDVINGVCGHVRCNAARGDRAMPRGWILRAEKHFGFLTPREMWPILHCGQRGSPADAPHPPNRCVALPTVQAAERPGAYGSTQDEPTRHGRHHATLGLQSRPALCSRTGSVVSCTRCRDCSTGDDHLHSESLV